MGNLFGIMTAIAPPMLILFIGGVSRKAGWLRSEADASISIVTIRILYPCFFFYHLVGNKEILLPLHLLSVVSAGFFSICIGFFCAFCIAKLFQLNPKSIPSFTFCSGIFNYGFFAFPVAEAIFGEHLIPNIILFNLGVETAIWSVGVFFLATNKFRLSRLVNPPIISIILAIIVREMGGQTVLPVFFWEIISMLAACAIPVGLLLIGGNFFDLLREFQLSDKIKVEISAVTVRLIIVPAILVLTAYYLPLDSEMEWLRKIFIIQSSMPAGIFAIVIVKHYQQNTKVALQAIFATMIGCIVTTPLWIYAGLKMLD